VLLAQAVPMRKSLTSSHGRLCGRSLVLVLNIFSELHDVSGKQDEHDCVIRSVAAQPTPILSLLAWCSRRGCMWVVRWAYTRVEVEVEYPTVARAHAE